MNTEVRPPTPGSDRFKVLPAVVPTAAYVALQPEDLPFGGPGGDVDGDSD